MGRLTRRAETEGVKAVCYGKNDVFLEGEPGYVEADKLAHYEDLEEARRLVVLPCKVGDRVFCILHSKNEIMEDVVEDYDIWSIKTGIKLRISLLNINDYVVGEFGKTVFLTREEAEAALKGEKDG